MRSSSYAAKYLDPADGTLRGAQPGAVHRFDIAGALSHLTRLLREGHASPAAHALLPTWRTDHVAMAAAEAGNPAVASDFELVNLP